MIVNIIDYRNDETGGGNNYTVTIRFRTEKEDGDTELKKTQSLYSNNLRKFRVDEDADPDERVRVTKDGDGAKIIPLRGTNWPGAIAGDAFDPANFNSTLSTVEYGDFARDELHGKDDNGLRECYRDVVLTYEPRSSGSPTPPNTSQGNDPDKWYPEYDRTSRTISRWKPLKFYGHITHEKFKDKEGPIDANDGDLEDAGQSQWKTTKGDRVLPVNSAGQRFDQVALTDFVEYVDTFTEYRRVYHDPAFDLHDRKNVVNQYNVIIYVAVNGESSPYPFILRYPKGAARLESFNVQSTVYTYQTEDEEGEEETVSIAAATIRTQISVSGDGHTVNMRNTGRMFRNNEGKLENVRTAEGPVKQDVSLTVFGRLLESTQESEEIPGSMIYGHEEVPFGGLLGNHSQIITPEPTPEEPNPESTEHIWLNVSLP